ncbi:MAG: response regulator [Chloroflexi bacterium]|nr:response regulator [Chloroflexota bacterium]
MKTVLIVDDEPSVRTLVRVTLENDQYRIIEASNGKEALALVEREHPALVLLDVMMPGPDGFEVCRQIKANPDTRSTMVIMLTARGHPQDRQRGLAAGADDYFSKPFSPLTLLGKVHDALGVG